MYTVTVPEIYLTRKRLTAVTTAAEGKAPTLQGAWLRFPVQVVSIPARKRHAKLVFHVQTFHMAKRLLGRLHRAGFVTAHLW